MAFYSPPVAGCAGFSHGPVFWPGPNAVSPEQPEQVLIYILQPTAPPLFRLLMSRWYDLNETGWPVRWSWQIVWWCFRFFLCLALGEDSCFTIILRVGHLFSYFPIGAVGMRIYVVVFIFFRYSLSHTKPSCRLNEAELPSNAIKVSLRDDVLPPKIERDALIQN